MTKSYSSVVAFRAFIIFLSCISVSAFLVTVPSSQLDQQKIFKPAYFVESVLDTSTIIFDDLITTNASDRSVYHSSSKIQCKPRDRDVVLSTLSMALGTSRDLSSEIYNRIESLNRWRSCTELIGAVSQSIRLGPERSKDPETVASALSQNVAWAGFNPCVSVGNEGVKILLAGGISKCSRMISERFGDRSVLKTGFHSVVEQIKKDLLITFADTKSLNPPLFNLSLDQNVFNSLERLTSCWGKGLCQPQDYSHRLKALSVVVLDATTGGLLGGVCEGELCGKYGGTDSSLQKALLFEAPPASVAKLVYALALAQDPKVDRELLQRQLKTSGQVGGLVSKRNVWWERSAICDSSGGLKCAVPSIAYSIATSFGWNRNCELRTYRCGRINLIGGSADDLYPGQVGRFPIHLASTHSKSSMISWNKYDSIRSGLVRPTAGKAYENTSAAVQSVIGAGDSRVSSLGLASVSMQIWRVSKGLPLLVPTLEISRQSYENSASQGAAQTSSSLQRAALTVLGGMKRVIEPEESGWQGAGTGYSAWINSMGRKCDSRCGVSMKTGTVSRQDSVFGGTTTATLLVDASAWAAWASRPVTPALKDKILAIGVIAVPHPTNVKRHNASHIGVELIREMLGGFNDEVQQR